MKIYYSPSNKLYFSNDSVVVCDCCQNPIKKVVFHCFIWQRKHTHERLYCIECQDNIKDEGKVMEEREVLLVNILPYDAYQIFFRPPTLINSNTPLSQLADRQYDSEDTVDRTVHCRNPSFMKDPRFKPFKLKGDKSLTLNQGLCHIDLLAESKPLIGYAGKKMLDTKKG